MGRPPTCTSWRAIVGAIALYALLLQSFLLAATPTLALGDAGILCLDHASGQPDSGGAPSGHEHHCCLPGHVAPLVPPLPAYQAVPWRAPEAALLGWRHEADQPRTGPPKRAHTPRGPPLA
jgi:hypothetical protein